MQFVLIKLICIIQGIAILTIVTTGDVFSYCFSQASKIRDFKSLIRSVGIFKNIIVLKSTQKDC